MYVRTYVHLNITTGSFLSNGPTNHIPTYTNLLSHVIAGELTIVSALHLSI